MTLAPVGVLLPLVHVVIVFATTAAVAVATASTRRTQQRKVYGAAVLWIQIEKIRAT